MKKWQKVLVIIVSILAVICVGGIILFKKVVIPKVTDVAIEKAVFFVVSDEYAARELIDSLSPEDKEFAQEVIEGYVLDKEARDCFKSFVKSNDYTAIKDYAILHLTEEQRNQALDMADKYQEFLPFEGRAMLEMYLNE